MEKVNVSLFESRRDAQEMPGGFARSHAIFITRRERAREKMTNSCRPPSGLDPSLLHSVLLASVYFRNNFYGEYNRYSSLSKQRMFL